VDVRPSLAFDSWPRCCSLRCRDCCRGRPSDPSPRRSETRGRLPLHTSSDLLTTSRHNPNTSTTRRGDLSAAVLRHRFSGNAPWSVRFCLTDESSFCRTVIPEARRASISHTQAARRGQDRPCRRGARGKKTRTGGSVPGNPTFHLNNVERQDLERDDPRRHSRHHRDSPRGRVRRRCCGLRVP